MSNENLKLTSQDGLDLLKIIEDATIKGRDSEFVSYLKSKVRDVDSLTKDDVVSLLNITNSVSFRGAECEALYFLKLKLKNLLQDAKKENVL